MSFAYGYHSYRSVQWTETCLPWNSCICSLLALCIHKAEVGYCIPISKKKWLQEVDECEIIGCFVVYLLIHYLCSPESVKFTFKKCLLPLFHDILISIWNPAWSFTFLCKPIVIRVIYVPFSWFILQWIPWYFTAVKCHLMIMLWPCDTGAKSFILLLSTFKCMRYMDLLNQLLSLFYSFCSFALH